MISVENLKHYRGRGVYVGRKVGNRKGSLLANPFKIKPHGSYERGESIALYRRWLWKEMQNQNSSVYKEILRLKQKAECGNLVLLCWCKQPDEEVACHADVIKSCIEWLVKEEEARMM